MISMILNQIAKYKSFENYVFKNYDLKIKIKIKNLFFFQITSKMIIFWKHKILEG